MSKGPKSHRLPPVERRGHGSEKQAGEIRNPLASVISNLEFVAETLGEGPEANETREAVADALVGARRVLALAEGQVEELEAVGAADEDRESGELTCPIRVLLIDDDPLVGRAIGRALRREGWVEHVLDPREALARLCDDPDGFDVVLCDVAMGPPDGPTLLREAVRHVPDLYARCLLVSGENRCARLEAFLHESGCGLLAKPFASRDLRARVRELALERATG